MPIPCGTFMPTFVVGAAVGRLFGEAFALLTEKSSESAQRLIFPGIYAVAGTMYHAVSLASYGFEVLLHLVVPSLIRCLS